MVLSWVNILFGTTYYETTQSLHYTLCITAFWSLLLVLNSMIIFVGRKVLQSHVFQVNGASPGVLNTESPVWSGHQLWETWRGRQPPATPTWRFVVLTAVESPKDLFICWSILWLNCSFSPIGVKNSTDSVRDTDSPIPPVPVEFTIHIGNDIDVSTAAQEVNLKNMMNAENHVEVRAEALTSRFAGISAG